MALQATVYRFPVQLSHVDRGVYEQLDLRVGRHPSETERYLLTRIIAYCLLVDPNDKDVTLEFSKGGLSSPDEPALSVHTLDGRIMCWVEIGNPTPERLHKASKAAPRVVVVTQHDPALLVKDIASSKTKVHKADQIDVYALDGKFLDAIAKHIGDRGCALELTVTDGELYVTAGGETLQSTLTKVALA